MKDRNFEQQEARRQRAKQFLPFDSLKGLHEVLREKEKAREREPRRELSEEEQEKLSGQLIRLEKGSEVEAVFYRAGRYVRLRGRVEEVDGVCKCLVLTAAGGDFRRIFFDSLYRIRVPD